MKHKQRNNKKTAALGLTAGLVAGTLGGMVLGVPTLTSAAAVEQPAESEPADGNEASAQGNRLRAALDPLVVDGTITGDQADAVTSHLVENRPDRPDRGDRHGRRGPGRNGALGPEVVTDLLGIDVGTLRTELRAGSTLAEIAEARGVSAEELVDEFVAEAQERIDVAVENGRLEADAAAEKIAALEERITERINGGS